MKRDFLTILLLMTIAVVSGAPVLAQEREVQIRPTARATRIAESPTLDGNVMGDPVWERIVPLTTFRQTTPDFGEPVSERTEVRIAYTADTLYFGVICFDSDLTGMTVSDARRDSSLDESDALRIILDTYADGQNGFVFGTNPAGLEYDGQVTNEGQGGGGGGGGGNQQSGSGSGFNVNWDGSWDVRTTTSETGWSAEFAIPFRTLRYSAGSNQTWGMNLQRTIRRRRENAYWAALPIQFDLHRVSQAGTLTALEIPSQRNLKLMPYLLGESRRQGSRSSATSLLGDAGVDAKYSITPALTLDATYNTDFAQVEVDEQQINLDRFNLFFPEKRPFFLENAGLFAVGNPGQAELFFSRRIGIGATGETIPIVGGARLSGRVGPVNIGFLNMQTEEAPGVSAANNFTVARIRRDFPNRTNVGAMFVGRQATGDLATQDDHNRAFAVDGRLGIGRTGLLNGFIARTATPGVASHQHAFQLQARNETQPLTLSVGFTETGQNFNPEVGFLTRAGGFKRLDLSAQGRYRPASLLNLQELRPHSTYRAFWNHQGFQETGYWHIDQHWELKNGSEFHTGTNFTREGVVRSFEIFPGVVVPPGTYDHREAQLVFFTSESAPLSGRIQVVSGGWFGGDRLQINPSGRLRVGEALNVNLSLSRSRLDLPGGSFVTNLASARISYSFSARVYVQSLVQYNDRADLWSTNFRFGWLQQANTGLFVVYNNSNSFERDDMIPIGTDHSLMVKVSRIFDVFN